MHKEIVKCFVWTDGNFHLMEIDNFLEYVNSQRDLRWELQGKCSDAQTQTDDSIW